MRFFDVDQGCSKGTDMNAFSTHASAEQGAIVESGPRALIEACDGQKVADLKIAVMPGEHAIDIMPSDSPQPNRGYTFYSPAPGRITLVAEGGHRYVVFVDFVASSDSPEEGGSGYQWVCYIKDRSSGKKVAWTERLPLSVQPV